MAVANTTISILPNNNVVYALPNQSNSTTSSSDIPVIYYVIVLVSLMLCCLAMILIFYWYHHRNLVNLIRTNSGRKDNLKSAQPVTVSQSSNPEQVINIDDTHNHTHSSAHNNAAIPAPSPSSKKLSKPPSKLQQTHTRSMDDNSQRSQSPKPATIEDKEIYHAVNNSNVYGMLPYIPNYNNLAMIVPGAANPASTVTALPAIPATPVQTNIESIDTLKVKSNDSAKFSIAPTEARTALSDITTSSSEDSITDDEMDNFDSVSTRMKGPRKIQKRMQNIQSFQSHSHKLDRYKRPSLKQRKVSNDTNITFRIKESMMSSNVLTDMTPTTMVSD